MHRNLNTNFAQVLYAMIYIGTRTFLSTHNSLYLSNLPISLLIKDRFCESHDDSRRVTFASSEYHFLAFNKS